MKSPVKYLPRVVDGELSLLLTSAGAVVIEGPKACGKTTTARQISASEILLDIDKNARLAIKVEPELVLKGAIPRLIDEWQMEPDIWNYIRRSIDKRGESGQFILTGSAIPADVITRHTGAGRLTRLFMRPMTLFETGHSTGKISLNDLLNGKPCKKVVSKLSITDIVECVVTGGWPICLGLSVEKSARLVKDYLDEIRRVEIKRVGKARHNPEKVGRMLTSLARNVSTAVSASTIASDSGIQDDTVREYLDILVRLMIVEPQPVWPTHLRSRTRLRKSPKWHFVDPSLAVAALGGSPELLLKDLEFFGFLFESLVIRDLRVFAQAMDAKVFYYRDALDLEVDAIVEVADGRWGVFEIKLGEGGIDKGAEKLLEFAAKVDTGKHGKPAVLGVIVGKGYGYLRDDGVSVIPIGALGP